MMRPGPSGAYEAVQPDKSIPQLQSAYSPAASELRTFILAYLDQQLRMIQSLQPEVIGHFDLFRLYTPQLDVNDPELNPEGEMGVWEAIERNVKEVVRHGGLFELNTAALRKGWDTAYPSRQIAEVSSVICNMRDEGSYISLSCGQAENSAFQTTRTALHKSVSIIIG